MISSLTIWFRNLLIPIVTSVQVELYENGKVLHIDKYSNLMVNNLLKEIDGLFLVESKSPYWFETEAYDQSSCFKKPSTHISVTCYTKDFLSNGFKKPFPIPIKYRKKMFDSLHTITPEPVGSKTWGSGIQVKFTLLKK